MDQFKCINLYNLQIRLLEKLLCVLVYANIKTYYSSLDNYKYPSCYNKGLLEVSKVQSYPSCDPILRSCAQFRPCSADEHYFLCQL